MGLFMNNLTLLYVEDDAALRDQFSDILGRYFAKVFTAEDGKKALELYDKHTIDLAILDISLPQVSGLEVATYIREHSSVPIIMMSAYTDQDKLLQAANLQIFAYLVKPVTFESFNATLRKVIASVNKSDTLDLAGGFTWNFTSQELQYNSELIRITKNEKKVLSLLCQHPRRYFQACEIQNELFHEANALQGECNNIVQLISRFKNKILKAFDVRDFFIDNSYGEGYRIKLD